jgi:hypothetical protein
MLDIVEKKQLDSLRNKIALTGAEIGATSIGEAIGLKKIAFPELDKLVERMEDSITEYKILRQKEVML